MFGTRKKLGKKFKLYSPPCNYIKTKGPGLAWKACLLSSSHTPLQASLSQLGIWGQDQLEPNTSWIKSDWDNKNNSSFAEQQLLRMSQSQTIKSKLDKTACDEQGFSEGAKLVPFTVHEAGGQKKDSMSKSHTGPWSYHFSSSGEGGNKQELSLKKDDSSGHVGAVGSTGMSWQPGCGTSAKHLRFTQGHCQAAAFLSPAEQRVTFSHNLYLPDTPCSLHSVQRERLPQGTPTNCNVNTDAHFKNYSRILSSSNNC